MGRHGRVAINPEEDEAEENGGDAPPGDQRGEAAQVLQDVRDRVAAEPAMCSKAVGELVMAGYPEAALELNMEYNRAGAMRMLADDLRFREGFEVLGIGLPLADPENWLEKLWAGREEQLAKEVDWTGRIWKVGSVAATAARLGEEEVARRLMVKAVELAEAHPEHPHLYTAWQYEMKFGLEEKAWQHYGAWLKEKKPKERDSALSGKHPEAAGTWWNFFQAETPEASLGELARSVKSLLDPKESKAFSADEVQAYVRRVEESGKGAGGDERAKTLEAAAAACEAHGLNALAHELWKQVEELKPSGQSALALADYFYSAQRWNDAATWYGRAWGRDRKLLFVLALQAKSLEKAGRSDESDRVNSLIRLWPTGKDDERMQIPFRLQGRGMMAEAREQYAVARRYVERPYNWLWLFDSEAEEKIDSAPAEAAKLWNLTRMMSFGDSMMISGDEVDGQYTGQQEIVQRIHCLRAVSLIDSKNFDAALREALLAEGAQPGGKKMALELVRFFDEVGAIERGDRVFEPMWSRRRKVVEDFPKAAEFHEQLAVIGATCRRRLDESLTHAERAVHLRPKQVSSRLALARVRLARGEGDAAQVHIREALDLEPQSVEAAKLQREIDEWRENSKN